MTEGQRKERDKAEKTQPPPRPRPVAPAPNPRTSPSWTQTVTHTDNKHSITARTSPLADSASGNTTHSCSTSDEEETDDSDLPSEVNGIPEHVRRAHAIATSGRRCALSRAARVLTEGHRKLPADVIAKLRALQVKPREEMPRSALMLPDPAFQIIDSELMAQTIR